MSGEPRIVNVRVKKAEKSLQSSNSRFARLRGMGEPCCRALAENAFRTRTMRIEIDTRTVSDWNEVSVEPRASPLFLLLLFLLGLSPSPGEL